MFIDFEIREVIDGESSDLRNPCGNKLQHCRREEHVIEFIHGHVGILSEYGKSEKTKGERGR